MINKSMFREYDIRGIYGTQLNEDVAYLVGRAFGTKLREQGLMSTVVGYDNRLSSVELERGMTKGLVDCGINVKRLGLITTPMCYYASNFLNVNTSMMITASHNPKEYNGFKFSFNGIHNAFGRDVMSLYDTIMEGKFIDGHGSIENVDITDEYVKLITGNLNFGKKIKLVYDCGNGTGSVIVKKIFEKLPMIESIGICDESDGTFPIHHPDPFVEENLTLLKEKVKETHADLGVGYDGDADRVGFVDENGNYVPIDKFLVIMWKYLINKVDKKECLFDVKCSKALYDELVKLGVKPIEYRTGNSYTRAASAEGDYPLSAELSGHVFFRDKFPGYDDGIYAGLRLAEMLSNTDKTLSEQLKEIVKYYSTPEIKYSTSDEKKFEIVKKMEEYAKSKNYSYITIDGVKVKFDDGFALVRASNTGPNITSRFEANTEERLEEIKNEFENVLKEYL